MARCKDEMTRSPWRAMSTPCHCTDNSIRKRTLTIRQLNSWNNITTNVWPFLKTSCMERSCTMASCGRAVSAARINFSGVDALWLTRRGGNSTRVPAHTQCLREVSLRASDDCSRGLTFSHWSISNLPCSLNRNITSHSMENVAFHSLLRWKMIILPILTTSLMHFLLGRLGECTFWTWEWKGYWMPKETNPNKKDKIAFW